MFVPMSTGFLSKLGHVRSKSRSRGQIKGKPCEYSRGHIFDCIHIKNGTYVYLIEVSVHFKYSKGLVFYVTAYESIIGKLFRKVRLGLCKEN